MLALLIAVGIGLHNFGEGLAIGAAFALGEAALGTLLIVGFTLHNTTEGLAIVAPLAKERPSIWTAGPARPDRRRADDRRRVARRVRLLAGLAVLFLGLGAGAIAQVVVQIVAADGRRRAVDARSRRGPSLARAVAGFAGDVRTACWSDVAVMYATGMLVG